MSRPGGRKVPPFGANLEVNEPKVPGNFKAPDETWTTGTDARPVADLPERLRKPMRVSSDQKSIGRIWLRVIIKFTAVTSFFYWAVYLMFTTSSESDISAISSPMFNSPSRSAHRTSVT